MVKVVPLVLEIIITYCPFVIPPVHDEYEVIFPLTDTDWVPN
jgi:hypothetical protein